MKRFFIVIGLLAAIVACEKDYYGDPPDDFGPPTIVLSGSRVLIDSIAWYTFSGTGSHDADGLWGIIKYRWDINGDGFWETPFTNKTDFVHVFKETGRHTVILEIADRFDQRSRDSLVFHTHGANQDTSHFIDPRDDQKYKTVRIAGLEWMAENLNYGELINVTDSAWDNGIVEKYSYNNNPDLKGEFGGFFTYYDWMEMMNHDTTSTEGICPPGWELPTREDWQKLIDHPRGINYLTQGGLSNLHLSRMLPQPRLQEWDQYDILRGVVDWTYFTRDFYTGYMNGPDKIIPYICTSLTSTHYLADRGHIYAIPYFNETIKKYTAIAPVRCIKRD